MDTFGIKLLIAIVCISLITFSGAVPPAYKRHLDTVYGRSIGIILILLTLEFAGWPVGILAVMTLLILLPTTSQEGFEGKAAGVEGFTILEKKKVGKEDRWFSEKVLGEKIKQISGDNILQLPVF
jgi:hypothetical protein